MPEPLTIKSVYQSEFRFVWRTLATLGVPEADIADATQEVFLVVYRRLAEFDQRSKVSTWIYQICLNVARQRRRRVERRREVACDSSELDETVAARSSTSEHLALFEWLLASMDLDQRAVFILFEVEGYSGPEIAELTDSPLATVYSRLRLARSTFARAAERHRASQSVNVRRAAV